MNAMARKATSRVSDAPAAMNQSHPEIEIFRMIKLRIEQAGSFERAPARKHARSDDRAFDGKQAFERHGFACRDGLEEGLAVVCWRAEQQRIGADQIDRRPERQSFDLHGEKIRLPQVVAVEKPNVFTVRVADPGIPRAAGAAVLLLDVNDSLEPRSDGASQFHCIGRLVVDQDHFVIAECLRENGSERFLNVRGDVVGRNDDAHERIGLDQCSLVNGRDQLCPPLLAIESVVPADSRIGSHRA